MTRYITISLLLTIVGLHCRGQITVHPGQLLFGTVTQQSDCVVDILIKNNSANPDFLLRHSFSHEFEVLISSKSIAPGQQEVIRVRFNPRTTGPFEEQIELFFASMKSPVILPVRADVKYVNPNGNLPCPDFSERAMDCCTNSMFLVEVLDEETNEPIDKANVRIEEDGNLWFGLITNAEGMVSHDMRIGFYELRADKKGYQPASIQSYINNRNNHFTLKLRKDLSFNPLEDALYIPPDSTFNSAGNQVLEESLFHPNNIVFLLDVSGSMGTGDKMDLLRISLSELAGVLRSVDKVTIVSYADEAKILLNTTSGNNRSEVTGIIQSLKAGGKTSGTKGFKRSFSVLKKYYIPGGNNQLIVITDGAFRPEDQAGIDDLVKKITRRGIRTSVVGIRSNAYAVEKLYDLSVTGNGSFLPINSESDAQSVLIEELKKQSRK